MRQVCNVPLSCDEQKHRRRHRRLRKTTPRPGATADSAAEPDREEVPELPVSVGREDSEAESLELGMAERLDEKRFQVSHSLTRFVLVTTESDGACYHKKNL